MPRSQGSEQSGLLFGKIRGNYAMIPPPCTAGHYCPTDTCPGGEIGRHRRLKISRQKCCTGSIPVPGTIEDYKSMSYSDLFILPT
jgi:hypothetical protein